MKDLEKLTASGVYSIDTRGKPMNTNTFYNQISKNFRISSNLELLSTVGFYRAGQLLEKAKRELKGDFGKLKKRLAEDGYHIRQQERHRKIANDKRITLHYNKLPPEWTFWEKLSQLNNEDFKKIEGLIHKKAKIKDIELFLGKKKKKGDGDKVPTNAKDNKDEIYAIEINQNLSKKYKDEFVQLKKDLIVLSKKYKFVSLKSKNKLIDVHEFLNNKKVDDDTTIVDNKNKFKKQYSTKKKIDI
jgi:hypothetical protein